ncbi:SWI/SNF-related matrix-associated actin-dependent regulator of chromatin subfamily E member 1-like isoform X2 [Oratosquilla oratoria]|uniref:SWI/SNF-related matrix-associated actin-dependent regulator of chromatin subfamily E member 1-like isoform X2 n=1 Tax=Oratosquilla oratoria TaxID=337810 RepID=UPI003F771AE1
MSLPPNYRQMAMMTPQATSQPTHVYMPGSPLTTNILKATTTSTSSSSSSNGGSGSSKDRLARTPGSSSKAVGESNVPSPFTPAHHSNPAFNPQKMGVTKGGVSLGDGRIPKPPKAPDKPLMPYMRYSRKVWDQVKAANPDLKLWEIGKIIGSMWRDLPEADRQDFVDEYESEKLEYEKAMKTYHASPSYQAYLNAKSKVASSDKCKRQFNPLPKDVQEPPSKRPNCVTAFKTGVAATEEKETLDRSSGSAASTKVDRRIDIQPAEDEEDYDDGLNVKHVSHARYMRNHRLINEIFSDTVVPDVRSVVTSQRLTVLKRQVQSLTMHQKKLEAELQQIEEKFEAKKRKFMEAGGLFQGELRKVKLTAPKLDETSFGLMVERQKEQIRRETEERQRSTQGHLPQNMSNSTNPSIPGTNPPGGLKEDSNDATGPAPQNTATFVENTPSPAPPSATGPGQESQANGPATESEEAENSENMEGGTDSSTPRNGPSSAVPVGAVSSAATTTDNQSPASAPS